MAFHSDIPVNSIQDLLSLLARLTSHVVSSFTKDDVVREKAKLPTRLGSLTGALQIHEVRVSREGRVEAKKLPTDASFFPLSMACSFTPVPLPASRLEAPVVEVVPEEGE